MDFEHWKNNPEFRGEGGGDGELYGHPTDMSRPGTPGSFMTGPTRTNTFESSRSRSQSRDPHSRVVSDGSDSTRVNEYGVEYPKGYHKTPSSALREQSPSGSEGGFSRPVTRRQESREGLMGNAGRMGQSAPPQLPTPYAPSPGGYGPIRVTSDETPGQEGGSYVS
jgi:hypothetical protein